MRAQPLGSLLDLLTHRELEVLSEMALGKNNRAIADSLVLSERAVEKNINGIFAKMGLSELQDVHRRVTAVLAFLELGSQANGLERGTNSLRH